MAKLSPTEKKFRSNRRNEFRRNILKAKIKQQSVKTVILAMLERYNLETDNSFPGIEKLMEDTGLSRSGVKKALSYAKAMNLIVRNRRMGTSTITTFNWAFTAADIDAGSHLIGYQSSPKMVEAVAHVGPDSGPSNGYSGGHLMATTVDTNITVEPISENIQEKNIKEEHTRKNIKSGGEDFKIQESRKDSDKDIDSLVDNLFGNIRSLRNYRAA